jgi:hypothetical protein
MLRRTLIALLSVVLFLPLELPAQNGGGHSSSRSSSRSSSSRSSSRSSSSRRSSSSKSTSARRSSKAKRTASDKPIHVTRTPRPSTSSGTRQRSTVAVRDSHGRIKRSAEARNDFMKQTGYAKGRKGYVVDHVVPLECGGADAPSNMQWQTAEAAKIKDRTERNCRR